MPDKEIEAAAREAVRAIGKALAVGLVSEFPKKEEREMAYGVLTAASVLLQTSMEGLPEGDRRGGMRMAVCMVQGFADAFDTNGDFGKEVSEIKNAGEALGKFL